MARARTQDDEDAAIVLTVLAALATSAGSAGPAESPFPATVWGDPAHRLRVRRPGTARWWAAGLPG